MSEPIEKCPLSALDERSLLLCIAQGPVNASGVVSGPRLYRRAGQPPALSARLLAAVILREVLEAGVAAQEGELDNACGAVPVLGDDHLGNIGERLVLRRRRLPRLAMAV